MTSWIVRLQTGRKPEYVPYGPFDNEAMAQDFADFLTSEVDPATVHRLRAPVGELLGYWASVREKGAPPADWRPEYWPPQPGHIWQDRNKDRWIGTGGNSGYLTCLSRVADDNAEHIWAHHGPMTFVQCVSPTEEEVPF